MTVCAEDNVAALSRASIGEASIVRILCCEGIILARLVKSGWRVRPGMVKVVVHDPQVERSSLSVVSIDILSYLAVILR